MGTLVVVAYDKPHKAEELRLKLRALRNKYLLDVAEAVVVVNDEQGKIKLRHAGDLTHDGAVYGGLYTSLANLVSTNAAADAAPGALAGVGINDQFMKELAAKLVPGSSVLFVLTRTPSPDREQILEELRGMGGKILMTSLSPEDHATLQTALSGVKS
jgi:uncharacterized membrane protein